MQIVMLNVVVAVLLEKMVDDTPDNDDDDDDKGASAAAPHCSASSSISETPAPGATGGSLPIYEAPVGEGPSSTGAGAGAAVADSPGSRTGSSDVADAPAAKTGGPRGAPVPVAGHPAGRVPPTAELHAMREQITYMQAQIEAICIALNVPPLAESAAVHRPGSTTPPHLHAWCLPERRPLLRTPARRPKPRGGLK